MVLLPQKTIVSNPLYCPVFTEEGPSLRFEKADAGLWIAAYPYHQMLSEDIRVVMGSQGIKRDLLNDTFRRNGFVTGALYKGEISTAFALPKVLTVSAYFRRPLSLKEALEEELLKETSYEEYLGSSRFLEDNFMREADKIHSVRPKIYEVTKKGDGIVEIITPRSGGKKKLPFWERVLDKLPRARPVTT